MESNRIVKKDGTGFATAESAKSALSKNAELNSDDWVVTEQEDGTFALIKREAGGPGRLQSFHDEDKSDEQTDATKQEDEDEDGSNNFIEKEGGGFFADEAEAAEEMKKRGLTTRTHQILSIGYDEGFVINRFDTPLTDEEVQEREEEAKGEKCWIIKFSPMRDENDTTQVPVGVNGEVINCNRGVEIPMMERYCEALDHAVKPIYKQKPGQPVKLIDSMPLYPYTKIRRIKPSKFEEYKKAGTEKNASDWDKRLIARD